MVYYLSGFQQYNNYHPIRRRPASSTGHHKNKTDARATPFSTKITAINQQAKEIKRPIRIHQLDMPLRPSHHQRPPESSAAEAQRSCRSNDPTHGGASKNDRDDVVGIGSHKTMPAATPPSSKDRSQKMQPSSRSSGADQLQLMKPIPPLTPV